MEFPYTYEQMLERAWKLLPSEVKEHKRFVIPKAICVSVGNRTYIQNFQSICETINREPRHVLRYMLKELATAGNLEDGRAMLQRRLSPQIIDETIRKYVKNYVICGECGKPDTRLVRERRFTFLVCEACGARFSVKKV